MPSTKILLQEGMDWITLLCAILNLNEWNGGEGFLGDKEERGGNVGA